MEQVQNYLNSGFFKLDSFTNLMKERITSAGTEEELQAAFELFDRDSDGVLNLEDLRKTATFLNIHIGQDDIKMMFEKADIDKDGKITFEDFCNLLN